jgi:hypothetical protein
MSHTWKLLPLAAFAVLGAFMLLPGSPARSVEVASAAIDCEETFRLRIDIINDDTGDRITVAGAQVRVSPDPQDGTGTRTYTDNGSNDDSSTVGRIEESEACEVTGSGGSPTAYVIELLSLPSALDCDIVEDEVSTTLTANTTVQLLVEDCEVGTPTATATGTTGPAATVQVQSSNQSLGCGNTAIVTITVRGANGQPVAAGTLVNVQASIGTVSPTSGTTSADGSVFVFYTAPNNQGGTATITAVAGSASGSTTVTVNCNVQPTQAPPPTTAPSGGGITPPSTGDGGLSGGSSWQTYAGIALIVASVIATLLVIRPRKA